MRRILTLLLFITVFSKLLGFNQADNPSDDLFFKKINVDKGLSQASANCFSEDKLGFIWIGTDDGLNRYDGVNMIIYRKRDGLSSSTILDIKVDSEDNLWLATASGLTKYNIHSETFTIYTDSTINNYYSRIVIDEKGKKIWLAANAGGIKYLDLEKNAIFTLEPDGFFESIPWDLLQINDREILVGTLRAGIYLLHLDDMSISPFLNDTSSAYKLPGNKIRGMIADGDVLFFGMESKGMAMYNMKTKTHQLYNTSNSGLSSDQIFCLEFDGKKNVMIGTDGGSLNVLDASSKTIECFPKEEANDRSISSDVIRTIYTDTEGNIWIGTYNNGVNFINKYSMPIGYFGKELLNPNSLSNNNVTGFAEGHSGDVWIGTDGGGLNHFKDGNFTIYKKEDGYINDNAILSVKMVPDGTLLVGTFRGGLNVYKNDVFKAYRHDPDDETSISNDWIWDIEVDHEGKYWIGTNAGLNMFEPENGKFTRFKPIGGFTYLNSQNSIRSLLIDSKDNLWIGSFGGLGKFNIKSGKFEFFIRSSTKEDGLSNEIIVKIFEDSKQNIWLATYGGGLSLFDKNTRKFKTYNKDHGLPSNLIESIEEDESGNLWLSTMNGLVKFDPLKESFQVLDMSFGLQGEVFKHKSSIKTSDGLMYFGGVNGFNVFWPDQVIFPDINKDIILTDFQVFNKSVSPKTHGEILGQSINFTKDITLDYAQSRFFSLQFSLPKYNIAEKINFAYKLEGFDESWNYIGNDRKLTFTNLKPKDYVLKIKASSSNIFPDDYTSFHFSIVPPFYLRKSFIATIFLLVILTIFGAFKLRSYRFRLMQNMLEGLVEEKNLEIKKQNRELKIQNVQLNQAKDQLLTINNTLEGKVKKRTKKLKFTVDQLNKSVKELDRFVYSASHDLSAPLKSIQGLVNIARLENKGHKLNVHLDYIEQSIFKLENVIKDLIQFSRNRRTELVYVDVNLFDLLMEIISSLKFMPNYDRLVFNIDIPSDTILQSDQQRLSTVLHNLISNAIKYQDIDKSECRIHVGFELFEDHWQFQIADNGIGISKEHSEKIFHMFYRATELSEGSGLGLFIVKEAIEKLGGSIKMESEPLVGSTFIVKFPLKKN